MGEQSPHARDPQPPDHVPAPAGAPADGTPRYAPGTAPPPAPREVPALPAWARGNGGAPPRPNPLPSPAAAPLPPSGPVPPPSASARALSPSGPVAPSALPPSGPLPPMPQSGPVPTSVAPSASARALPLSGPVAPSALPPSGPVPAMARVGGVAPRTTALPGTGPRPMVPPVPAAMPAGHWPPRRAAGPGPFRIRRWHVLVVVAALLLGMASVGAVAWRSWRATRASAPVIGRAAADALQSLPAVRLRYTYLGGDGRVVDGSLVVTAQRYASGTVTDAGSGTAALRATPAGTAVYGDADWWGRRAPDRVSRVEGRWVRPDPFVAFPVDVGALRPSELAGVVRAIGTHGRVSGQAGTVRGTRVVTVAYGGWTMAVTADEPRRLVSLGLPVRPSGIRPAAWADGGTRVVPAGWGTGTRAVPVGDTGGGGYLTVDPSDGNARDADATRSDADRTMRGGAGAPSGVPAPSGTPGPGASASPDAPPPAQSDLPAARPDFTARINASDCSTPSCGLSVTVANDGDAPGDAVVTASVTPGMAPRSVDLGEIPAGGSRTTPTMSYPNQAPTPGPGQTTSTTVSAAADVYSPQLDGDDKPRYDYLRGKGIDPDTDETLRRIDPALKDGVVGALYGMLRSGVDAADAQNAVRAADSAGLLPDVGALAAAGDRLTGWDVLARALGQGSTDAPALADKRRGVERAREYLARDPDCRVALSPLTRKNGGDGGLRVTGTCPATRYPAPSGAPGVSRAHCLGEPLDADSWAVYRNPDPVRGDRATGAVGCFGSSAGKVVTAAPSDPPGRRAGMDRGHLIGRQFGGISGSENMVPLYPDANQIVMKAIEGEAAKLAKSERVYYAVTPIYADLANPLVPTAVELIWETAAGRLETAIILNRP